MHAAIFASCVAKNAARAVARASLNAEDVTERAAANVIIMDLGEWDDIHTQDHKGTVVIPTGATNPPSP